jgi:hypothetical protein
LLASLQFPQLTITAIAESIVHDRGLYGTDSTYVVGIFRGLELALTDSDGAAIRREIEQPRRRCPPKRVMRSLPNHYPKTPGSEVP